MSSKNKSAYPSWAPRFWHGMLLSDWLALVAANRCRIHPVRLGLATTITSLTFFNSFMRLIHDAAYHRKIERTKLIDDPVFILGHWRSGTTYLHELLSRDPRFASPTTFQCFAANHFLLTQAWMPRLLWFLMPRKRPMDNVRTGWDLPQEDEFALCSRGIRSPYLRIAFPNSAPWYLDYLDLENLNDSELRRWKTEFNYFLKALTVSAGKQLVLKSPTHTGRIAVLAEMYPRAKFIHIVRDPRSIWPSSVKLWRVMDEAQGLQRPHYRYLESYIETAFRRMYDAYNKGREQLDPTRLCEVRYEDVTADPVGEIRRIYQQLALNDFQLVQPRIQEFVQQQGTYQTNQYQLDPQQQQEIMSRWSEYAKRYGYSS